VLFGAFSPVLLDLASHLESHPWARTALIFPWLAWLAARSNPETRTDPLTAVVWTGLCSGLLLELVAVSGGTPRIGRVGLVVGLFALVWGARWAKWAPALVLLWVIPSPTLLLELFSPGLEQGIGALCSALVPHVILGAAGEAPALISSYGATLVLEPFSGGLALVWPLAGIGVFRAAAQGMGTREAAGTVARWALLAAPIQCLIVLGAGVALAAGEGARIGTRVLDHAGWILVVVLGLVQSRAFRHSKVRADVDAVLC
jgi:hypothetical protein